jgi:hypothetical protein
MLGGAGGAHGDHTEWNIDNVRDGERKRRRTILAQL